MLACLTRPSSNFQLMNGVPARSLGHANAPARTPKSTGLLVPSPNASQQASRLATNAYIGELDGLRNIVQKKGFAPEDAGRFRRSQSRRLQLIPAPINARKRHRRDVFFVLARRKSRSRMIDGVFLNMVGIIGAAGNAPSDAAAVSPTTQ